MRLEGHLRNLTAAAGLTCASRARLGLKYRSELPSEPALRLVHTVRLGTVKRLPLVMRWLIVVIDRRLLLTVKQHTMLWTTSSSSAALHPLTKFLHGQRICGVVQLPNIELHM